jgi:hypothetical protein
MRPRAPHSYSCFKAGAFPAEKERGEVMLHPNFERELGRERVARMRAEVEHSHLEARLAREARFAKASGLSEEARLAKARLREETVLRGGLLGRGTTIVAALFR